MAGDIDIMRIVDAGHMAFSQGPTIDALEWDAMYCHGPAAVRSQLEFATVALSTVVQLPAPPPVGRNVELRAGASAAVPTAVMAARKRRHH